MPIEGCGKAIEAPTTGRVRNDSMREQSENVRERYRKYYPLFTFWAQL